MDGNRFDDLSRKLAMPRTRRGVLGVVGAAVAGLVTGSPATAAPKTDKPGKCYGGGSHCTNAKQCCSGVCTNRQCEPEIAPECAMSSDCPGVDTECQVRTCVSGQCGVRFTPAGTPLAVQTAGDCQTAVCDGIGGVTSTADNADIPKDGNSCTDDLCTDGVPSNPPLPAGTACGEAGELVCNGAGGCGNCVPGTAESCYSGPAGTAGVGICQEGTRTCLADGSGFSACTGEVTPSPEMCNNLDDNCDGNVDDGAICPPLPNAVSGCSNGECGIVACQAGFADCDLDPANGCETYVVNNAQNCGSCGHVCQGAPNAFPACVGGACALTCAQGFYNCNGNVFDGCECPVNRGCQFGQCCSLAGQTPLTGLPCCSGSINIFNGTCL